MVISIAVMEVLVKYLLSIYSESQGHWPNKLLLPSRTLSIGLTVSQSVH